MNSRLKGMGIISTIFVCISIYYFESIITETTVLRPTFREIILLKEEVLTSGNQEQI